MSKLTSNKHKSNKADIYVLFIHLFISTDSRKDTMLLTNNGPFYNKIIGFEGFAVHQTEFSYTECIMCVHVLEASYIFFSYKLTCRHKVEEVVHLYIRWDGSYC